MRCVDARIARSSTLLLTLLAVGCHRGGEPAGDAPTPTSASRERMAELLELLGERIDPSTDPFLNARRVELLEGKDVPDTEPGRSRHLLALGRELLRAGRTDEAVDRLRGLADDPSVPDDLRPAVRRELAIAFLRLGEQDNCLQGHSPESCLLPIRGGGIHRDPTGASHAFDLLTALLEEDPDDSGARWLLNLAAMTLGRYPESVPERWLVPPTVFASETDLARFPDVAGAAGLDVDGTAGGGVVDDLDGDGYLDVLASSWSVGDPLRFLHNRRDGTFEDRSRAAGLEGLTGGLNLVHADYDNDGRPDVLVLRGAWLGVNGHFPNSLLRNLGGGRFEDVTEAAGLLTFRPTQTAAWADVDGDGWLDLFVGNESLPRDPRPCELYLNQGDGTFVESARRAGVDVRGYVKGVAWGDVDEDGRPDLYVSELLGENRLFHNEGPDEQGVVRFRDVTAEAGVAEPEHSFATWFWDYDQDSCLDLFVAGYGLDYFTEGGSAVAAEYLGREVGPDRSYLYRGHCDGRFDDVSVAVGLDRLSYVMGANYGDLDNDGYPDLYAGTGAPEFSSLVPNRLFRNDGGKRFLDVTSAARMGHLQKGHAVSFADLDNDGDQDVYAVMGGAYEGDRYPNALFLNPGGPNHWVTLRLEGTSSNRSAVGARVRVDVATPAGGRSVYTTVGTGGSFGASSLQAEIGLGDAIRIDRIVIRWPGGEQQTLSTVRLDSVYAVRQDASEAEPLTLAPLEIPAHDPSEAVP
ncbi:MAG: CRTAC1 family protein [Thermoanaerobaculia bacterium]